MAIHIDSDGNFYFGASGTVDFDNITYVPDFSVTKDGVLTAKSGTIGGINLASDHIKSTNYSTTSGSEAGFKIDSNGDAFFNKISIRVDGSPDGTPDSFQHLRLGTGSIFYNEFSDDLVLSAPQIAIVDNSGTPGATSPTLIFTDGTYSNPGFYAEENNADQRAEFYFSNGTHDIFHTRSGMNVLYLDATYLSVHDGIGQNGDVLTRTSNGLEWTTTSGSHQDGDHTSFADSSHSHSESDISNIGSHTHASNASWLNNDHGSHTPLGASGGNNGSSGNAARFDHSHSSSNVTVSAANVQSIASYFLRRLTASNNVITYERSDFGSGLKINSQRPTSNNSSSVGISTIEYSEMHARSGMFTFVYGANLGSSSEEIKTDITDLDLGLDFINDLSPKKYKYVSQVKEDDGKYGYGFIAEDIEEVLIDNSETDSKLFVDGRDDYESYGRCAHELTCTCEDEDCCTPPTETYNADTGEHTSTEGCMFDAKCVKPCCTDIAGATIDGINYVHATEAECEEEFIVSQKYPSLKYDELIAPLVKAVQELSTQILDLTARVEALEG